MTSFSRKNMLLGLLLTFSVCGYINARFNIHDYDRPKTISLDIGFDDTEADRPSIDKTSIDWFDMTYVGYSSSRNNLSLNYFVDAVVIGNVGSSWSDDTDSGTLHFVIEAIDFKNRNTLISARFECNSNDVSYDECCNDLKSAKRKIMNYFLFKNRLILCNKGQQR